MSFRYPAGSSWRKWDLHAHTPLDHEWSNRPRLSTEAEKVSFAADYVSAALDAGLAAIAVTDHNFCETSEDLLIPYIQRQAAQPPLVVLPGFEVTVSDCGGTHLLVIFSEDTSLPLINDVMKQLFPPGRERFRNGAVMPSEESAEALWGILMKSCLPYLIAFAHADRENGVLNQRGGDLRARLWQSHFISIAQVSKHLSQSPGFLSSIADQTNCAYRRPMAYVLGSDCRRLRQDGSDSSSCALGERSTWIKADPTFEGLRQIVFEPEARVRLQEHEPERKPDYLLIKSARFLDDQDRFQPQPIPLSPDLTAIVGGKSTGKSILLTTIARAVDPEEADRRSEVSSVNVYDFDGLDLEVTWCDGTTDLLSAPSGRHKITFLPQMYIHKLVEGENRPQLATSILGFLRQDEAFNTQYSTLCRRVEERTGDLQAAVMEFLSLLAAWQDVSKRLRELGDAGTIAVEQSNVATQQEELRASSGFTPLETSQYQMQSQRVATLTKALEYLHRHDHAFVEIGTSVREAVQMVRTNLQAIPADVCTRHGLSDDDRLKAESALRPVAEAMEQALGAFEQAMAQILSASHRSHETQSGQLQEARVSLQPFLAKIRNQQQVVELQERADSLQRTVDAIQSRSAEKTDIETRYHAKSRQVKQLLTAHLAAKRELSSLLRDERYANVGDGISIVATLGFDHARFQTAFLELFDLRSSLDRFGVTFERNQLCWSEDTHVEVMFTMLQTLLRSKHEELHLRAGRTRNEAIAALVTDFLEHSFSLRQSGEDILTMSPGKQGLVLLELFLHLSSATYPILIDQPEDSLDNRTIYTRLARFLGKKKGQRQIIIVTHNPNLVVGTDAEEVIVGNQDGEGQEENARYRFEYVSGSLECSFHKSDAPSVLTSQGIREHVCQVLEGGVEAFRQREMRYSLSVGQGFPATLGRHGASADPVR